jgi:hypothetical protein
VELWSPGQSLYGDETCTTQGIELFFRTQSFLTRAIFDPKVPRRKVFDLLMVIFVHYRCIVIFDFAMLIAYFFDPERSFFNHADQKSFRPSSACNLSGKDCAA